jgi:WD40 repeat protein
VTRINVGRRSDRSKTKIKACPREAPRSGGDQPDQKPKTNLDPAKPRGRAAISPIKNQKPSLTPRSHPDPAKPPDGFVFAVAISPDGGTMLTGSWDWTGRLWDVATYQPRGVGSRT